MLWTAAQITKHPLDELERLKAIQTSQPAAIALLVLASVKSPKLDQFVRKSNLHAPADAWMSPILSRAIHLAPAAITSSVVAPLILQDPSTALSIIKRVPNRAVIKGAWLESLWETVPDARISLIEMATSLALADHGAICALDWINRWLWLAQESDDEHFYTSHPLGLWDALEEQLKADSAAFDAIPTHWVGFSYAPEHFLERVYRYRFPALDSALIAICDLGTPNLCPSNYRARDQIDALDHTDIELAALWGTSSGNAKMDTSVSAQMLTARAAERCAAQYFRSLGLHVDDVAQLQLNGSTDEWRLMDLKVEHRYGVDVKNLRRTLNGGMHSSRWKVKAFKTDARGADVLLCGVSSPYTKLDRDGRLTCDTFEEMSVLGVTTASETRSLLNKFDHIYRLHVHSTTKLVELPAWSWDYPTAHYRARNIALRELRDWLTKSRQNSIPKKIREAFPPVLLVLCNTPAFLANSERSEQQNAFLEMLMATVPGNRGTGAERYLLRLPQLYLFVLHFWLHWRAQKKDINTSELTSLFQWGFTVSKHSPRSEDSASTAPKSSTTHASRWEPVSLAASVGIVDPTDTIGTLLQALTALETKLSQSTFLKLSDLSIFENGVLVGTFPDGKRRTLLAHCGGRDVLRNQAECGFRPLVYAREKTCACGRLICPKCECCSDPRFSDCAPQKDRLTARPSEEWVRY
ncbi:hypothetical protein [Lysobacter sp. A03]|uniref:hypothetical protein n=1 Tax=Lysobacter sp. A03 TaxID=1199154 RepID=UPI001269D869|nr:hypothetical protein [Lysobacter sp. A03]